MFPGPQSTLLLLAASQDPSTLRLIKTLADRNGWDTETVEIGWGVLGRLQYGSAPSVLLLDSGEQANGIKTLRWIRKLHPNLPMVVIVPDQDGESEQNVLRLGVLELVTRPIQEKSLDAVIKRLLHRTTWMNRRLDLDKGDTEWIAEEDAFFVASSTVMRQLRSQLVILAQLDAPVLITGEGGSGQEIAAQLIHRLSVRSGGKFTTVNCGAFSEQVLEIELFGRDSEARGRCLSSQPGKVELSEKGTIFLEDLSEMSLSLQAKLLHMLREKQIWPVGASGARDVDVRVVVSLGTDAQVAISRRKLLADLYYCLSAFTVPIPPLRQRTDELLFLLDCFMRQLSAQYSLPTRTFPLRLLNACQNYSWPGNLRELENFVRRYLVIGDDDLALKEVTEAASGSDPAGGPMRGSLLTGDFEQLSSLKSLVDSVKVETERNAITAALEKTHWNRKAAARLLNVSYRSLLYKIEQYHMSPPADVSPVGEDSAEDHRSAVIPLLPRSRPH